MWGSPGILQGIPSALPAQEALWLCAGAALSGLPLVADGLDLRPRQGDTQGTQTVPAVHAPILDDYAGAPVGTMGGGRCGI
jgi:hypothetical protein